MIETPCRMLRSIQMLDDSTVEIVFNEGILIELEDMKDGYSVLHEFTKGRPMKKLLITGKRTEISKEARLFGHEQSLKHKDQVIAEAIIVHSLYQKMIINFYTRFIKDSYPTRFFTDYDKAKEWLKAF